MPNHKSCEKRLRQDKRKAVMNHQVKREIKTLKKRILSEIPLEEKENVLGLYSSRLDKAAKRHIIHKNTASRKKSRMARYLKKQRTADTN